MELFGGGNHFKTLLILYEIAPTCVDWNYGVQPMPKVPKAFVLWPIEKQTLRTYPYLTPLG